MTTVSTMTMVAEETGQTPKPPLKRSLFNRPAWSRPQNTASVEDVFHRSTTSYADLAAEADRKRKAKLATKHAGQVKEEADKEGGWKRRRLSSDSEDDSDGASVQSKHCAHLKSSKVKKSHTTALAKPEEPKAVQSNAETTCHSSPASTSKDVSAAQPKSSATNIIDLEDDSDGTSAPQEDNHYGIIQAKETLPPEDDDFPVSDDEYAELARKAREKARRKRLEDDLIPAIKKPSPSVEPESQFRRSLSTQPLHTPPAVSDPEVHILITSTLENTKPLIIKRKLSQRLKDVRITWCQHQHFTEDMTSTVFLTWRGKRLFDVTSCKSLGITVDADGNVMTKGQEDLFGEEEQKIHMEAMTEALLEQYRNAKRRRTEEPEVDEEVTPPPQKPQEAQTKIILKAKGFDDLKLIVKPVSPANFLTVKVRELRNDPSRLLSRGLLRLFVKQIRHARKAKTFTSCSTETGCSQKSKLGKRSSAIWIILMSMSDNAGQAALLPSANMA